MRLSAIAGLLALATLPSLHAETLYQVTDLGSLRPDMRARASGINNNGDVSGWSYKTRHRYHAFRVRDGVMKDLGALGDDFSYASGINDDGDVIGSSPPGTGSSPHAFVYRGGDLIDLGTLGGPTSYAWGINNAGHVVGQADGSGGTHAFLHKNGKMRDLGTLGGSYSSAQSINDFGQVVGASATADGTIRAFVYHDGVMTNLGADKGISSSASAINSAGEVAGTYTFAEGQYGAYLYSGGEFHDLGGLPNRPYCIPYAMSDKSEVVGSCALDFSQRSAAFLYRDGRMIDLNKKLDSVSGAGWVLLDAAAINKAGQIVGSGKRGGLLRAYLLTPMKP